MARTEGLPSRGASRFCSIMANEDYEIIDFILNLFTENEMYDGDIYGRIDEKYNYAQKPLLILKRLIREGFISEMGEAYLSLSAEGRKAKKGYKRYLRWQKFWQLIDKANKASTLVKFLYSVGLFAAGWVTRSLLSKYL